MANRLAGETSAYLLQHQHNPVDWYPWGEQAFARARELDRPLLISIGYSSCHWCHVMERESFQDPATAALMNAQLVCIKVDREERPDVDQLYMDCVVRLTGQGGWPLNVFCLPDGRPVFGGTYYPPQPAHGRPSFREVVGAIARAYADRRGSLEQQAERILDVLRSEPAGGPALHPWQQTLGELCRALMARADQSYGGFGEAPKFPTPVNLEAILLASSLGAAPAGALEHVLFTLKRMARGGLFDQLGGGFHRYSTDARWLVPHFEKMLYDQGQLLRVYAEAYRQTRDAELQWPVAETIAYLERELRGPEGGLYASQDADSEGEEGRYYVWTPAQIGAVLGPQTGPAFCDAYAVTLRGTFERSGASVLEHALAGERPRFAPERARLLEARAQRVAPATDTKQIAAWIGYAIGGMASAGAAFGRADWVAGAARAADFALDVLRAGPGQWLRIWDGRSARVPIFLDDCAALLCGLLDLHRAGGADRYLAAALELAELLCTRFFDPGVGRLWYSGSGDPQLVRRPQTDSDGATPAASGLAALGLVRAAALSGRAELRAVADAVLAASGQLAERVPLALPTLIRAGALREHEPGLALVVGAPDALATRALAERARALLGADEAVVVGAPGALPAELDPLYREGREAPAGEGREAPAGEGREAPAGEGREAAAQPTAYLCRGRVCSAPARAPEELALPMP